MTAFTGTLLWKGPYLHSSYILAIITCSDVTNDYTFAVDGGTPDLNFSSVTAAWIAPATDAADKLASVDHDGSTVTFRAESTFPTTNTIILFVLGTAKAA